MPPVTKIQKFKTFNASPVPWIIALGGAFYYFGFSRYWIGSYEDDAGYVLGGLSIAQGTLNELSFPVAVPWTTYFPGLPLLLAPFVRLVDPHWDLLKWVPWAMHFLDDFKFL